MTERDDDGRSVAVVSQTLRDLKAVVGSTPVQSVFPELDSPEKGE